MKNRMRLSLLLVAFVTAGLSAFQAQPRLPNPPKPFVGKVVSVADGDTISVLYDGVKFPIRLETIDAPEMTQAYGAQAKKALEGKIAGKEVNIVWKSKDKYGRIRGEVFLEDRRLCLEMVAEGYAWHYLKYSKDPQLATAEKEAREAKRGLWSEANPTPPWEYRLRKESDKTMDPAKVLVYVTKSGTKYHLENCQHLKNGQSEISLADAVQRKYEPCAKCKPPVVTNESEK